MYFTGFHYRDNRTTHTAIGAIASEAPRKTPKPFLAEATRTACAAKCSEKDQMAARQTEDN